MSLNQQYKASGSQIPFKDWLYQQQMDGKIDFTMSEEKNKSMGFEIAGIPITYILLGTLVIIGGVYAYRKFKQ